MILVANCGSAADAGFSPSVFMQPDSAITTLFHAERPSHGAADVQR
jgi:hypothetical protein